MCYFVGTENTTVQCEDTGGMKWRVTNTHFCEIYGMGKEANSAYHAHWLMQAWTDTLRNVLGSVFKAPKSLI